MRDDGREIEGGGEIQSERDGERDGGVMQSERDGERDRGGRYRVREMGREIERGGDTE